MKISHDWLKSYIDLSEPADEVASWLTGTGLEVEHVERFESIPGGLEGLLVGEVLTCMKHPNADKLSLTTVDVGHDRILTIVCGAPNVAAGQKVIVAPPGTTIHPTGKESFTIQKAKIRGEVSEGMICAEDEISLGNNHAGIIVLPPTAKKGSPVSDLFPVFHDNVFEIGLTPNRADAFSHIGVARDIKALKGRDIRWPSVDNFKVKNKDLVIPVTVKDANACPRYTSVTISGVSVGESPEWLKQRLRSIGLTPINNVVDITNFVCHEVGQPLHAFDTAKISGKKILVKTLPKGTPFVTLDGKTRTLTETDLMICDEKGGLCIAGVFGGIGSGITAETTSVFLESATFSSEYIRRTTIHHQLNTDASFRFARGTDPSLTLYALKRAALLMEEIAGGEISSEISDLYPNPVPKHELVIKDSHVNRLIGKEFKRDQVKAILSHLDIETVKESANEYVVSIPTYRHEVQQEADVVEEFLRIYGFNNIPLETNARTDYIADFPSTSVDQVRQTLGQLLAGNGYFEIWTNSLSSERLQAKFASSLPGEPVRILNKLSEELGVMRQTLLFSMLEVCAYNLNRKQKNQKLFEFGKIYYRQDGGYVEQERLGLLLTGSMEDPNWQHKEHPVTYFDAAQIVSNILRRCGYSSYEQVSFEDALFHHGVTFQIEGKQVCHIGRVNATVNHEFGIKQEIFEAEVDMALLLRGANPKLVIQDVPKFPAVTRDLSLILDRGVTFREVRDLALRIGKRLVCEVNAFDVYEGQNIPKGKKAYAVTFTLQDPSKTLTEEEIEGMMNELMRGFEKELGATIRR